jgi:hypothetical protein
MDTSVGTGKRKAPIGAASRANERQTPWGRISQRIVDLGLGMNYH